jgi:lysine-N-methylase
MLLRVPDFYDSFRCIADKCTDTCCIGWEIDIDETSAKRYSAIKGEFGDRLRQNIEDGHFKLLPGDRCPFLKRDGLCDMICHLGEPSLCDICREHPRFVEVYGDIMEKGLGLCCEEAVRLLLESKETATAPISFVEREINDIPDEIPDDAIEARDAIFKERDNLFLILRNQSKPLHKRLIDLLDYAIETSGIEIPNKKISNNIHQSWFNVLGKGESFGPAWDATYKQLLQNGWVPSSNLFSDSDGEKIIAYLLFRYYGKSLFDGNSLTKVEFALYFWIILQKIGSLFALETGTASAKPEASNLQSVKINAIKLLSKQIEYSEEIMAILDEEFMENPVFSPQIFRKILLE